MNNLKSNALKNILCSPGQTLIETLAAMFILVTGISAAVGLAIFAFNSSSAVVKQIIATGLAREGLEIVKNMRDTNWLQDTITTHGCYNFASNPVGQMTADCYQHWLGNSSPPPPFCLDPTGGSAPCGTSPVASTDNIVGFDSSTFNFFVKYRSTDTGFLGYGLTFDPANTGTTGFYSSNPSGFAPGLSCADGAVSTAGLPISDYCRKIIISKDSTTSPYNQPNFPLIKVQSQVWWVDKKCPRVPDFANASAGCRVELDVYLTNWKTS